MTEPNEESAAREEIDRLRANPELVPKDSQERLELVERLRKAIGVESEEMLDAATLINAYRFCSARVKTQHANDGVQLITGFADAAAEALVEMLWIGSENEIGFKDISSDFPVKSAFAAALFSGVEIGIQAEEMRRG